MKAVPEKTVEIWTAQALLKKLGPQIGIWSPSSGADQGFSTGSSQQTDSKRFWLEMKSPELMAQPHNNWWEFPQQLTTPITTDTARRTKIDIAQLLRYVDVHLGRLIGKPCSRPQQRCPGCRPVTNGSPSMADVVYVLPAPSAYVPPNNGTAMLLSEHHVRDTFSHWTYVIRASRLLELLAKHGSSETKQKVAKKARLCLRNGRYERDEVVSVWLEHGYTLAELSAEKGVGPPHVQLLPTFARYLQVLNDCFEPRWLTTRTDDPGHLPDDLDDPSGAQVSHGAGQSRGVSGLGAIDFGELEDEITNIVDRFEEELPPPSDVASEPSGSGYWHGSHLICVEMPLQR